MLFSNRKFHSRNLLDKGNTNSPVLQWKLGSILTGQTGPELLRTYNIEREKVAATLIEFDRTWAKQMSSKSKKEANGDKGPSEDFSETFVKAGRFTAGLTSTYEDSLITRSSGSIQELASNLKVGMRFPSRQVVRFCDAKAMQLVKALPADGRWRIVIFTGDIRRDVVAGKLKQVCCGPSPIAPVYVDISSWGIISSQITVRSASTQPPVLISIVSSK